MERITVAPVVVLQTSERTSPLTLVTREMTTAIQKTAPAVRAKFRAAAAGMTRRAVTKRTPHPLNAEHHHNCEKNREKILVNGDMDLSSRRQLWIQADEHQPVVGKKLDDDRDDEKKNQSNEFRQGRS